MTAPFDTEAIAVSPIFQSLILASAGVKVAVTLTVLPSTIETDEGFISIVGFLTSNGPITAVCLSPPSL